ncbi:hypothetical protein OOK29_25955 [Streptomyces phaeochromogenes]|uniref:hypothetical protein n=1 Tax=Streptomyces phaeochromogenes TaxID=1923 RepID=UPI002256669F|nr:hypothetical protein [Streptomyces phaeochromogenes]MCX5601599.1 hypothetical protein [Streptomyces phaeochromogenes]
MPYEYFCYGCDAVSPERRARRDDAEDELVEHRRQEHGGLRPDLGDGVRQVHAEARGDRFLPNGSCLGVLFLLALVLANCWGR